MTRNCTIRLQVLDAPEQRLLGHVLGVLGPTGGPSSVGHNQLADFCQRPYGVIARRGSHVAPSDTPGFDGSTKMGGDSVSSPNVSMPAACLHLRVHLIGTNLSQHE